VPSIGARSRCLPTSVRLTGHLGSRRSTSYVIVRRRRNRIRRIDRRRPLRKISGRPAGRPPGRRGRRPVGARSRWTRRLEESAERRRSRIAESDHVRQRSVCLLSADATGASGPGRRSAVAAA